MCNPHEDYCDVCGESLANCTCKMPDADKVKRVYILKNLGCANCAAKMEHKIKELPGVTYANISFVTKQLRLSADNHEALLPQIQEICTAIESEVVVEIQNSASFTEAYILCAWGEKCYALAYPLFGGSLARIGYMSNGSGAYNIGGGGRTYRIHSDYENFSQRQTYEDVVTGDIFENSTGDMYSIASDAGRFGLFHWSDNWSGVRVQSVWIKKNNELMIDLIPVRVKSLGCFYDTRGIGGINSDGSLRNDGLYFSKRQDLIITGPDK